VCVKKKKKKIRTPSKIKDDLGYDIGHERTRIGLRLQGQYIWKMESDTEEALDTGAFGPETPETLAETFAMDTGTTVEDQDHPTDYDYDLPMMTLSVQCKPCARRNKSVRFLALRQLDHHTKEQHIGVHITCRCSRCGKGFQKRHATEYHIPKCKVRSRSGHDWPSNASCARTSSAQP